MEIQRIQSGNVNATQQLFPVTSAATNRLCETPSAAGQGNAWELSAANQTLREFWSTLAPPADDPLPFFGRFVQNHNGNAQAYSDAIGEGDGAGAPGVIGLEPVKKAKTTYSDAIGEGDGAVAAGPSFEPPRPVKKAYSDAIGEGDGGTAPVLVGGNTGDARGSGKRPAYTMAVGEGDF